MEMLTTDIDKLTTLGDMCTAGRLSDLDIKQSGALILRAANELKALRADFSALDRLYDQTNLLLAGCVVEHEMTGNVNDTIKDARRFYEGLKEAHLQSKQQASTPSEQTSGT